MIRIGSVVKHPLFAGPGTVLAIHQQESGAVIYEVYWQAHGRSGFHSGTQLRLHTQPGSTGEEV